MKREIKFRAWDLRIKCYRSLGTIQMALTGKLFILIPDTNSEGLLTESIDDLIIEQFTGLTDKNGKEIYEGDTLKISFTEYYSNDAVTVDEETETIGNVCFHSGGWFVEEKDSTWFYLYDILESADLEIIGNIHENQ